MANKLLLIVLLLFAPFFASAAVLYLTPEQQDYYPGDVFIISLRIDAESECVNTVQSSLFFDANILEALDFSKANSIVSFWAQEPEISQAKGEISFIGGIPGGFCGQLPGDPGQSNLIGRAIFQVRNKDFSLSGSETTGVWPGNSQVLLNDGFGTPANLIVKSSVLTLLPGQPQSFKQEWVEELKNDNIAPEDFKIEITSDPALFNGQYFVLFSATDKQTGIDYFAVKEGEGDWQLAQSPYLLKDQTLQSKVLVKAVDKAGNNKVIERWPEAKEKLNYRSLLLIAFLAVVSACFFLFILNKKKKEEPILPA